jgi:hypothetical protein
MFSRAARVPMDVKLNKKRQPAISGLRWASFETSGSMGLAVLKERSMIQAPEATAAKSAPERRTAE